VIATNLRGTFLYSLMRRNMFRMAAASWLSPAAFWQSPSRLTVPTSLPSGVEGLVHVLANELRGRNITVNAVAPGQVQTELFLKGKSEARIDELKKMNPLEGSACQKTWQI